MESIKRERKGISDKTKKQVASVVIAVCFLLFVFSTFNFIYPLKAFLLGVFGFMIYPILLLVILFCVAILTNKKFVYSVRYLIYLFLCYFFFVCVLHIIVTNFSNQNLSYGKYLLACFNSINTPGGLLVGIFTFPLTSLLHNVAGIVVYSILFIISLYFVISYLDGIKQGKIKPPVPKTYANFNKISNDLEELEREEASIKENKVEENFEDTSALKTMENETLKKLNSDEDDIFIKDEEDSSEVNKAKAKLGLIASDGEEEEEREEEKPSSKLFEKKSEDDYWKLRGLNKEREDKPQKFVYDNVRNNQIKNKALNDENANYLKTLYEPNLDRNNPIINAENYEDYMNRMKIYNETHSRPFERDYSSSNESEKKAYEDLRPKVESNFGIEPNVPSNKIPSFYNYNENKENEQEEKYNSSKNDYESSYKQDIEQSENFNFSSNIEGLDDEYLKPVNRESSVSPLNPVNFDLSQDKFNKPIEDETPKFVDRIERNEEPFKTSRLDEGDISSSLGKSYNLPKSLMPNRASSGVNDSSDDEQEDKNAPDFRYSGKYVRPPIDLLETYVNEEDLSTNHERNIEVLERALDEFRIPAKVEAVRRGASVTRYELHMPAGIPVRKIHAHASDIALALAAKGDVRIETPIKGKSAVGIEVPNAKIDKVGLKDIIASQEFATSKAPLNFALGKNVDGNVCCCNLAKMPHLLVAGSTGSGKSVCLNSLLISLIYKTSPQDLRLILVDPKFVEFGVYNDLPHLLTPKVITDPKKALNALDWLVNEMERRYLLFQDCYVRGIEEYNEQTEVVTKKWQKLPYIVAVIDEFGDIILTAGRKELEEKIVRLTQKARAAGIHIILATQRPSVEVITGTIKANLPARISFKVTSAVDSKTILDSGGAEKLIGRGDMLYSPSDGEPMRLQGAYVDTPEIKRIIEFVKQNNKAVYDEKISKMINSEGGASGGVGNTATVGASAGEEFDSLMPDALKMVIENGQASISMLQRRFSIGFARAARIIDQMELAKFISSSDGSKPRNVFITMEDYNQIYGGRGL